MSLTKQTILLHTQVVPLHMLLPLPGIPFPSFYLVSTVHPITSHCHLQERSRTRPALAMTPKAPVYDLFPE